MGGSAQRSERVTEDLLLPTGSEAASPLKQAVAERLASHRQRRESERASQQDSEARARARAEEARTASRRGAANVREAVQARYRESQSYREFLAAEAERALAQAQAEADVAARNAAAIAEAQTKLLADMSSWEVRKPSPAEVAEIRSELAHELADIALGARELIAEPPMLSIVETAPVRGITVQMETEFAPSAQTVAKARVLAEPIPAEELAELEDEIAFRHAPDIAPHTVESEPIPANIIQFPRQLIAPRKARPRLAEGPLLEESATEPQLRIFEVEANQIATEPEAVTEVTGAPGWQSLLLESNAALHDTAPASSQSNLTFAPQAAPVHLRLMSAAVDVVCVAAATLVAATVAGYICGPRLLDLKLPVIAGAALGTFAFFFLAFQMLFFTLSDATPGMRYARIAFCTFGDDYPTRKALRRRAFATVLAACPLGIGLAWMWMDDDRLGWHDRISRMYQRAY